MLQNSGLLRQKKIISYRISQPLCDILNFSDAPQVQLWATLYSWWFVYLHRSFNKSYFGLHRTVQRWIRLQEFGSFLSGGWLFLMKTYYWPLIAQISFEINISTKRHFSVIIIILTHTEVKWKTYKMFKNFLVFWEVVKCNVNDFTVIPNLYWTLVKIN